MSCVPHSVAALISDGLFETLSAELSQFPMTLSELHCISDLGSLVVMFPNRNVIAQPPRNCPGWGKTTTKKCVNKMFQVLSQSGSGSFAFILKPFLLHSATDTDRQPDKAIFMGHVA